MSTPRRHHYVPRVHIRYFKKLNGYQLFLKEEKELRNPKSSKHIFVKKDLNTSGKEDGEKDFTSFENEITKKWDNNYNKYLKDVELNLNTPHKIGNETLLFFFEYCLIGRMRRLKLDLNVEDIINPFKEGLPEYIDFLKTEDVQKKISKENLSDLKRIVESFTKNLSKYEQIQKQVKYSASIPSEFKMLLPSSCYCILYHTKDNSFILPDCTGVAYKSEHTFNWNGIDYNKVSFVGIPLTPNLFLEIRNCDVFDEGSNFLYQPDKREINTINQRLFDFAFTQVLLSNPEAIKSILNNQI